MKHFHLGAASGILAAASDGVIFAWRNASTTSIQYIERVRFALSPVVLPSSAGGQEASIALFLQSVFSANYTGGTDLVAAPRTRLFDSQRVLPTAASSVIAAGNVQIADTADMTAGGGDTIDTHPWSRRSKHIPAATAGAHPEELVLEWKNPSQADHHNDPQQGCMVLRPNTGFIVTLPVALGTAFTARLTAEVDWLE